MEGLPPFQLYNLKNDPGETNNVIDQNPEIVLQLKNLLKSYILNGRSTPGKKQKNDNVDNWPEIDWIYDN